MSTTQDSCDSGFFVSLEGIDYSGKSSICDFLESKFLANKIPFIRFQQPDRSSPYFKKILHFSKLHQQDQNPIDLAKIFIQERILLSQKINIALAKNLFVFCDRFDLSTFAYQGLSGADFQSIWELHQYDQPVGTIHPNITIFLDIPPQVALQRKAAYTYPKEGFDIYFDRFSHELNSFEQTILHYKAAIQWLQNLHPQRKFVTINATESLHEIADKILSFSNILTKQ